MKRIGQLVRGRGGKRDPLAEDPPPPSQHCAAFGCPLPGGISPSTSGQHTAWYCRFHFGQSTGAFDATTAEIRDRIGAGELDTSGVEYGRSPSATVLEMRARLKQRPPA